ncbi:MAG: hypothetical protein L0154_28215 [Chloroflexi bacterium]|nr:hypothetical protein [Chloroflexota bacterium]
MKGILKLLVLFFGLALFGLVGIEYFWLSFVCGSAGIAVFSMVILWGMHDYARDHDKMREALSGILSIDPAPRRNLVLTFLLMVIAGCTVLFLLSLPFYSLHSNTRQNMWLYIASTALVIPILLITARNFYFLERERITKPFRSHILLWLAIGSVYVAEQVLSGGGLLVILLIIGYVALMQRRVNQKLRMYGQKNEFTNYLEFVEGDPMPFRYFQPTFKSYNKIYAHLQLGDFEAAKEGAIDILQSKSAINIGLERYQQTINVLGLAISGEHNLTAQKLLEAALSMGSPPSNIYDSLGDLYLSQKYAPDAAINLFDSALAQVPNTKNRDAKGFIPLHNVGKAWALALLGRSVEADALIDSIKVDYDDNIPLFAEYHYRLGQARLAQNKTDQAVEHFSLASTADSVGIHGNNAREMLAQIQS